MVAYIQVWGSAGAEVSMLGDGRTVIGRELTNDVVLAADPAVSRAHAVVERYPSGWTIRDLGTSNGTYVNGTRLAGEHVLHPGDAIRIGSTELVFRADVAEGSGLTTVRLGDEPPELTRRERDVLVALCRPVVGPGPFPQPATVEEMAEELVVSKAAIRFHLSNLYDKFGIAESGPTRRAELANAALIRGAVYRAELH